MSTSSMGSGSRVVAIIQARMASSRLPGKVLMDIHGAAMVDRVVERTRRASRVNRVLVATSSDASDDPIEAHCLRQDVECFRGSHFDVLDRYRSAAHAASAEVVVRITADCPLIDPGLIDKTVTTLGGAGSTGFDFAATRLPPPWVRTYPIGLDVEACRMEALESAWRHAERPEEREHVMPYLYDGTSPTTVAPGVDAGVSRNGMRIAVLHCDEELGAMRWTVDTKDDLEFIRQVYAAFGGRDDFSWLEVTELIASRPELALVNSQVHHKSVGDVDGRFRAGADE